MRFETIIHPDVPHGPPQSLSNCKKVGPHVYLLNP